MKQLKLLCVLVAITTVLLIGCSKDNNQKGGNGSTTTAYKKHWIPNWYSNDYLIGVIDSNGIYLADTLQTLTKGDTSCLIYHGQKLYVWNEPLGVDSFINNQNTYINCCINKIPFDTSGAWSHSIFTTASPYKFLNQMGQWQHQAQGIIITNYKKFKPVMLGDYTSAITH